MKFSATLLLFVAVCCASHPVAPTVLPLPTNITCSDGCIALASNFNIQIAGPGSNDTFAQAAAARTLRMIVTSGSRGEAVASACPLPSSTLKNVTVIISQIRPIGTYPQLGDDESYSLVIGNGAGTLRAATVWGAMHGLSTLTQLVVWPVIPSGSVNITDSPRFSHRGAMIDTGRNFLSTQLIMATLDAMSYVKLNVLHWHISDDESFPMYSTAWPNLTAGAYQAPSISHVYSLDDVENVIMAAAMRGIRVIPEFDIPGHATSWYAGYPQLRTECVLPPVGFTAPMNPVSNFTYDFLQRFLNEMQERFPDQFLHLGGDEVEMQCWLNNSDVLAFMRQHGMTQPSQVQLYFEKKVAGFLVKRSVIWEENFGAENEYPLNSVVEVWRERHGNLTVLEAVVRSGRDVIYTTPDWYLDYSTLSDGFDRYINGPSQWEFAHSVDPLWNTTLSTEEQKRVLGGEVAMWGPYEDGTNFMPTVFPRAAAIAERLWSQSLGYEGKSSSLQRRMHAMRCRLLARDIGCAPVMWGGSCPRVYTPSYTPPY